MDFKKHLPILILVVLVFIGLGLRSMRLEQLAGFDFDQETAAWWIKRLLVDHKPSLVGQEISVGGVFIGPLFYYLLAVFYFLARMDPIAANIMVTLISTGTIILIFLVAQRVFNERVGLLAVFFYSFSFQINFYDRTTAPSNLVMFLSLLLLYTLVSPVDLSKKIVAAGIIFGLALSVHPTVFLLLPVTGLFFLKEKVRISLKVIAISLAIFLLFFLPLAVFEARHEFIGLARGFESALLPNLTDQTYPPIFKLIINLRTLVFAFTAIIWPKAGSLEQAGMLIILGWFLHWAWSCVPQRKWFFFWVLTPVVLLSFYRQIVPEYYFLLVFPIFLIFQAAFWEKILFSRAWIIAGLFLLTFSIVNLIMLFLYDNPVGMSYKKMAVNYIAQQSFSQPIAIKMITDLGQNNGFSYLFYWRRISLSSQVKNRYIIAIPARNGSASGKIFGDIKVIKE